MNFKDEYRKYNEEIKPNKEFLEKLTDDMNKERSSRISYRRSRILAAASAACVCLVILGGIAVSSLLSRDIDISVVGGDSSAATEITTGAFGMHCWYSDDMSDDEIINCLANRLANSGDVDKVYKSEDNSFDDDELLCEEEINILSDKLARARATEKKSENNNAKHYMLIFENGDIVKLSEYDDYIVLKDTGCYYEIK